MTIERSVAKLEAQQEAMASDINEMKTALSTIANTMKTLSGIEQRQVNLTDALNRAHKRIDDIQGVIKDEVKGHERRIQSIELNLAKNQWVERVFMAVIMSVIGLWLKGGI